MLHILLADGFEEIEAITAIDILRRCGLEVQLISVTGKRIITGAHGISVMADTLYRYSSISESDCIILPGGMPAAETLLAFDKLRKMIVTQFRRGRLVAAICAAPMVLGESGILEGIRATCYPGFEKYLHGAILTEGQVVEDGAVITANGPAAARPFAFAIAARLVSAEVIDKVKRGMNFPE